MYQVTTYVRALLYEFIRIIHVDDVAESQPRILLILTETQLIGIDLECENLTEIQCPYLVLKNTSPITSLTSIIQVNYLLFLYHHFRICRAVVIGGRCHFLKYPSHWSFTTTDTI